MLSNEKKTYDQVNASLADPEKQKQLLQQDEEEDFLDECKAFSKAIENQRMLNTIISSSECKPTRKWLSTSFEAGGMHFAPGNHWISPRNIPDFAKDFQTFH